MDKHAIDWKQLVRYLGGELSAEEQRRIKEWTAADPEHEQFIYFLEKIWESPAEEKQEWNTDAAWARYRALYKESLDIGKEQSAIRLHPIAYNRRTRSDRISWLYRLGGMAATIAVTILIIFLTYEPVQEIQSPPPSRQVVTRHGQITHLRLSDGTLVIINAGSKLTVPEVFPDSVRKVRLSGEAYFEVARDPDRPFVVYTGNAVTRVLGTKFGVTAYGEDGRVAVVVVEGKVALRSVAASRNHGRKITKNQMGVVTKAGRTSVSEVDNITSYLGWTKGKLVFAHDSLEQVITRLERWYDINIELRDPGLAARKFTGSFTARQPLAEVLDAIALSLGLEYERGTAAIYFNIKE